MKVAVIYTGQLRTISKTIKFLKENVLLNENVHIFATLQADKEDTFILKELEKHLKSLLWFSKDDSLWKSIQVRLLQNMPVAPNIKSYLYYSGSMIEYYQLQLSYERLMLYEMQNNFKYDYIIRCRPDTIFAKPINFSWLNLSDEEILYRMKYIETHFNNSKNLKPEKLLTYFMSTIIHKDLLKNINDICYEEIPKEGQYINKNDLWVSKFLESYSVKSLKEYIKNGMYILTIRKNLMYIVKRNLFGIIPSLGSFYGNLVFFQNKHWWNSESQFRSACAYSQLSIYNYSSEFEEKSIHDYNDKRYFDENGNLKNNEILYILCRK